MPRGKQFYYLSDPDAEQFKFSLNVSIFRVRILMDLFCVLFVLLGKIKKQK